MLPINKFTSEISLPSTNPRRNIAGNLTWQGYQFLTLGHEKEKVWIKAVPDGHTYRIANEALGLLLGTALGVPVIDKAAIISVRSDSAGVEFLKENGCDPYVWVTRNMGRTLCVNSTKKKVCELAFTEAGVRLVLINTLLDNWDQVTLVASDKDTVSVIDFDKAFNATNWPMLKKIERSNRTNWIAAFASIGRPALDSFNQRAQSGIRDLENSLSSIDEEFNLVANYLGICEIAQRMVIERLRSEIMGLHDFCSNAIQDHPYFSQSDVRN